MTGDEIQQLNTGCRLRVLSCYGGLVRWDRMTSSGWKFDNEWTLKGWRDIVAADSKVLVVAETERSREFDLVAPTGDTNKNGKSEENAI